MENTENKSVQTVLTISNTDIVTMLMVQQKEILKNKLPELHKTLVSIEDIYIEKVKETLNLRIAENKNIVPLREAIYTINRIYNPNIEFRVEFNQTIDELATTIILNTFNRGFYCSVNKDVVVDYLPDLAIYVGAPGMDEEEKSRLGDRFHWVVDINIYEIPHKHKDIIVITPEHRDAWKEAHDKLNEIHKLIKDDSKLKEQIVAKMTEKAIAANTELQTIVGEILLLE
jgi:hypothetical protein